MWCMSLIRKKATAHGCTLVLVLVVASTPRAIIAQGDEAAILKDRVMKELPGALARLEALYSHVTISGTSTRERWRRSSPQGRPAGGEKVSRPAPEAAIAGLESTSSRKVLFQASGDLRKVYQAVLFDKLYDKKTDSMRDSPSSPTNPAKSVVCVGRDYSFRLRWQKDVPILATYGAANDEDTNSTVSLWRRLMMEVPCGLIVDRHLRELMSLPSFSIGKITRKPGSRGENLVIEFQFALSDLKNRVLPKGYVPKNPHQIWKGWAEVSPNDAWAVQGSGAGSPDPQAQQLRHEVLYGAQRDGVPIPKRITLFEPYALRTHTLEIENFDFGPRPDSEFTLSFYGLPELSVSTRSARVNRFAVAAFVAAVAALAASIGLKFFVRTRKNS
jgi:hypothetical protein